MIDFYFDYVSPYAYLAATQIRELAGKHGHEVRPHPVLFAGLLAASGSLGPAEVPLRRDYLFHDIVRLARWLGVPIAPPVAHPFNPLAALRATLAVPVEERWPVVDALFRAAWVESRSLEDPTAIVPVPAVTPDVKDRLRADTEAAAAAKIFGVPSMVVDGELFWGVDSLVLLERFLGGQDPPDPALVARFLALPAASQRRR